MAAEAIAIDLYEPVRSAPGEQALWCAALQLLIEDAARHIQGKRAWTGKPGSDEQREAFEDVVAVGPMLRWVCAHSGHDAEWVSWAFRRRWGSVAGTPAKPLADCLKRAV